MTGRALHLVLFALDTSVGNFQHWCCTVYNMEGHPKKQIRAALDQADTARFKVSPTTAHGHSWGYIDCLNCAGRFYVWSTASADVHARQDPPLRPASQSP